MFAGKAQTASGLVEAVHSIVSLKSSFTDTGVSVFAGVSTVVISEHSEEELSERDFIDVSSEDCVQNKRNKRRTSLSN